jgi:hypothetical protein
MSISDDEEGTEWKCEEKIRNKFKNHKKFSASVKRYGLMPTT